MIETIIEAVQSKRYSFNNEKELQDGIELALQNRNVQYIREAIVPPKDRVDFLVGSIGVEVKIKSSLANLTRQIHRYAQWEGISSVLVITSLNRLRNLPATLNGKPVHVIVIGAIGAFL